MSNTGDKETLSLASVPKQRLELRKKGDGAQVKQSFSHGRTKTVQVEVRKKRTIMRGTPPADAEPKGDTPVATPEPASVDSAPSPEPKTAAARARNKETLRSRNARSEPLRAAEESADARNADNLSDTERAARARALQGALAAREADMAQREIEEARRAEVEAQRIAALEAQKAAEEKRRREEESRRQAEEEAQRQALAEAEAAKAAAAAPADGAKRSTQAAKQATRAAVPGRALLEDEEQTARRRASTRPRPGASRRGDGNRRRGGRISVTDALSDEQEERMRSLASVRRERERQRQARRQTISETKIVREVVIPETITVQELANRMAERGRDVVRVLMGMDVIATLTQNIDADTAELVVSEMGHRAKRVSASDVELGLYGEDDDERDLLPRPPVVTVMGHVDHGKTSLLDALRKANVVAGEAGGITQHIGAYQVSTSNGEKITFIDTPGHAAFTAMRARGAKVTDIVILVVAADDGVMPQTVEAINHAKAAEVPIVLAVNKMDKAESNPDRVKQELLQHEVIVEEMGGDVLAVELSALKKTGLDKLEEALLLSAELLELKANPNRPAEGVVIESKLDRGRGPVATVLVQRGTLQVGDIVVAGREWGKVRALVDSKNARVKHAAPSVPVEILGLSGAPEAGDPFATVESEARAREITEYRREEERSRSARTAMPSSIEQMLSQAKDAAKQRLAVVVKGDVQGSVEAIAGALGNLKTDEVEVQVLHQAVGGINESDIALAAASHALVVGFNVRANAQARDAAQNQGVEIRYYSVIYELVDDAKAMLGGLLAPEAREKIIGNAQILEIFNISKAGKVAGCRVTSGIVRRNAHVRVLRDSVVIHDGALKTLRHFKDEVREVREGSECGIALENFQDLKESDVFEIYEVEEVQRTL